MNLNITRIIPILYCKPRTAVFDPSDNNNNNNNIIVLAGYVVTISRLIIFTCPSEPVIIQAFISLFASPLLVAACVCCCCCSSPIITLSVSMIQSEIPLCPPFRTGPVRFRSSFSPLNCSTTTTTPASVGSYSIPPLRKSGSSCVSPVGDLHNNTQLCSLPLASFCYK